MKPPPGTGPLGLQVPRAFEGKRLARDSPARADQKVLPVVGRSETSRSVRGPLRGARDASLVGPEGVAA